MGARLACSPARHRHSTGPQDVRTAKKKARQTGPEACLPGLTADTTVFAIGRNAENKVRKAGRQWIASRGLP